MLYLQLFIKKYFFKKKAMAITIADRSTWMARVSVSGGQAAVQVYGSMPCSNGGRLRRSDRRPRWLGRHLLINSDGSDRSVSGRHGGTSACGVLARTLSPSRRHYPPISVTSSIHRAHTIHCRSTTYTCPCLDPKLGDSTWNGIRHIVL
jgi:hypothetical protein